MNAERQLNLLKQAQHHLETGYALVREALREGPLRLNREESLDLWRAQVQMVEDAIPALEAFVKNDLHLLMEEGQTQITRKQIWRLYFMKKEHGIDSLDEMDELRAREEEESEARHAAWREQEALWMAEQRMYDICRDEYWNRVSSVYSKFGLYRPRICIGTTKQGRACSASSFRLGDEPYCVHHHPEAAMMKVKTAEWQAFFGLTIAEFDQEFQRSIVPMRRAIDILWNQFAALFGGR